MEIERKFTVEKLPDNLSSYKFHLIEQAYLCTDPVVRVRREDDKYYMTYKGKGLLAREEANLPLTEYSYEHLLEKADGNIISKKRYIIPISHPQFADSYVLPDKYLSEEATLFVELDIFDEPFKPLVIAEVEFPDEEMANAFLPLDWFDEDVTENPAYHNSNLSKKVF